jgi:DNA repair exonuclease SbcCD ATPase subunit
MTDGELKPLIEQASGVDTLVRAYKIARENLLAVEHEHDSWRLNHVHAERTVTETQQRVEEMKALRASYEAKRKDNLNQLAETLKDHVERARIYQAQRNDVDPVRIQKEIDKLDAAIDAVHAEQEEETRLSVALSDTQGEHMSCKAIYNRAADDARAAAARLEAIKSQVGKLCGECGKTYAEHDLARATELSKAKVVDLITKAREIKEDTQEREKDALEAHRKLAEHRSRRTDIKGTVSERERLANALVGRRRAEDGLKNETENAQKVKARIDALKVEANPYIVLLDGAEDAFQAAAEAFKTSEVAGEELIERIGVMGDVVKVYGPAGVRAHILDNVTPFLNQRTAEYLGTMSDGRISAIWSTLSTNAKGDLVEKFAITVTKDHGGGSFASLSGGEKRKVRLGCALALQDLVASRASKPIDLFIGDELDDALDEAGLERLMTVLETKARERGTVLVISHSDIRDWIRNTATLTMENGLSTLTPGVLA